MTPFFLPVKGSRTPSRAIMKIMADKKTLELQIKLIAEQASAQIRQLSGEFRSIAGEAQAVSRNIRENGTTFTNLKAAAEQAATSFRLFGENSSELRSLQQQLKKSALELVEQGLEPESEEVQNLVEQYRELGDQADQMERKEGGLLSMFNDLKSEIGSLAVAAAAIKLDQFVVDMGSYALQQADALDTVRNNFGIMLGDMQAGAALADKINSFNVNTPFNLDQVSQATQVLYTAKVSLSDMEEYLTRFGDLAQGNAGKFQSFTKAYQKAAAKGKADMEVLNIYLEQGIPILDTLAANMGTTSGAITEMASKGQVSFQDLTNAIKTMTDEGGGYFGTMAMASESWESVQAGLHESLNSLAASIGEMLMPVMKTLVSWITKVVDAINDSPILKGVLMAALSALVVFINGKMIVAVVALIAKLWGQYAAQMGVNAAMGAANPVILAATIAVAGLTAGYVAFAASQQGAAQRTNEQTLAMHEQKKAVDDLISSMESMDAAQRTHTAETLRAQTAAAQKELVAAQSAVSRLKAAGKDHLRGESYQIDGQWYTAASDEYDRALAHEEEAKRKVRELQDLLSAADKSASESYKANQARRAADSSAFVESIYSATDSGKIEKLKEDLARLTKIIEDPKTTESLKKRAQAAVTYINEQLAQVGKKAGKAPTPAVTVPVEFTTEWSDRQLDDEARVELERSRSIEKLKDLGLKALGAKYEQEERYAAELQALNLHYDGELEAIRMRRIDERAEKERRVAEAGWTDRVRELTEDSFSQLAAQKVRDMAELEKIAIEAYGLAAYQKQDEYNKQMMALEEYYAKKRAEAEEQRRESLLQKYTKGLSDISRRFELEMAEAIDRGDTWGAVKASAASAAIQSVQNSEAGRVAGGFATGGVVGGFVAIIGEFVKDLSEAVQSLKNGKEFMNGISVIVGEIMDKIGPWIEYVVDDTVELFHAFGGVLGNLLRVIIQLVAIINDLIPITDIIITVIKVIGGLLDGLSRGLSWLYEKITGKKLDSLIDSAGDLADANEELVEAYKKQKEAINDLLSRQIKSIQTQYELGLMTRGQYDEMAAAYRRTAEEQTSEIERKEKELESQSEYGSWTWDDLGDWWGGVWEGIKDFFKDCFDGITGWLGDIWEAISGVFKNMGSGIKDAATTAGSWLKDAASSVGSWVKDAASSVGSWVKGLFGHADGSTNIEFDHIARVHQGEAVIPKTFAEGIRSGDMALVGGKNNRANGGNTIVLELNVHGSVVSERELVDVVYDGISKGIRTGQKQPLTA